MLVVVHGIGHASAESTSQLEEIKQALARNGHLAVFAQDVACGGADDVCAQLWSRAEAVLTVGPRPGFAEAHDAQTPDVPPFAWPEVPPVDPTEAAYPRQAEAFRRVLAALYRQHLAKNADYSPANILATGELGILVRVADKALRLLSLAGFEVKIVEPGTFAGPRRANHESIDDSWLDLANYGVIAAVVRRGDWGR